jgi:hypothetical protein
LSLQSVSVRDSPSTYPWVLLAALRHLSACACYKPRWLCSGFKLTLQVLVCCGFSCGSNPACTLPLDDWFYQPIGLYP